MNNINRTPMACLLVLLSSTAACNLDFLTEDEHAQLQSMAVPPLPPSPSNSFADNPTAAQLGQQFFYDKRFSGPIVEASVDLGPVGATETMSCATCHDPARWSTLPTPRGSSGTGAATRCGARPWGPSRATWR
jgi:cytochrome c peroxidase